MSSVWEEVWLEAEQMAEGVLAEMQPVRCVPVLGLHERCEHDPAVGEPTFGGVSR